MTENIEALNGMYLGIVSLVCLLTYLAVSRKAPEKKLPEQRRFPVLRSYFRKHERMS
jgi:hypothetical protein